MGFAHTHIRNFLKKVSYESSKTFKIIWLFLCVYLPFKGHSDVTFEGLYKPNSRRSRIHLKATSSTDATSSRLRSRGLKRSPLRRSHCATRKSQIKIKKLNQITFLLCRVVRMPQWRAFAQRLRERQVEAPHPYFTFSKTSDLDAQRTV